MEVLLFVGAVTVGKNITIMRSLVVFSLLAIVVSVWAQDPAKGWLGYAKGVYPAGKRITYIEAKWKVPDNPKRDGAFFSPWFGIETSDNLNLIQPVNPWSSNHWEIYNEYFQWKPVHNENSASHNVKAGDIVFGSVTYTDQAYEIVHTNLADKWSVKTTIPVQKLEDQYKNYTIIYFVFEKVYACSYYPPNNEVTFFDIKVQYDGQTVNPTWTTAYVDNACNNRARIINSTSIQITWTST